MRSAIAYDESYAVDHGHDSEVLGRLKVSSLERWLTRLNLDISELRICEIGFGSGWPLAYMNQHAHAVYGIEAIPENLQSAVRLGVNPSCLFDSSQLPGTLPKPIDLWVYQDSFEHITDVHSHLPSGRSYLPLVARRPDKGLGTGRLHLTSVVSPA